MSPELKCAESAGALGIPERKSFERALGSGDFPAARALLLEQPSLARARALGRDPLFWAASRSSLARLIPLLISLGAAADDPDGEFSNRPLDWACENANREGARLLLGAGALARASSFESCFSSKAPESCVSALLEFGASGVFSFFPQRLTLAQRLLSLGKSNDQGEALALIERQELALSLPAGALHEEDAEDARRI